MIKLNFLRQLFTFSTIRYSYENLKAFELNKEIRSCITLEELDLYIKSHDQQIRLFATTSVLEYLNEYPLTYLFKSFDSPLAVYRYTFTLKASNMYQEQLKYANMSKIQSYATQESAYLQDLIKQQCEHILTRKQKEPFDVVDALNQIVIQKGNQTRLIQYSMEVICNTPASISQNILSKLLTLVLKKMSDFQWRALSKYKNLFNFLIYNYKISNQTPKQLISILEKLTNLKLHLLGYDRIPNAIYQIFNKIQDKLESQQIYWLQIVFQCFENLPTNFNSVMYSKVYDQIIKKSKQSTLFLQLLPINKMTKLQLQNVMASFFERELQIYTSIYFINFEKSNRFFLSSIFVKQIEKLFFNSYFHSEKTIAINYVGYIAIAKSLLDYYQFNSQSRGKVLAKMMQLQKFTKCLSVENSLAEMASICNMFNIVQIHIETKLWDDEDQLYRRMGLMLKKFNDKKFSSNWKALKHFQQIREVLHKHANSKHPKILQFISYLLKGDLQKTSVFQQSYHPAIIFAFTQSQNHQFFKQIVNTVYKLIQTTDIPSFIDVYLRYEDKNSIINNQLINRLWKLHPRFQTIGKFISGVSLIYFQNENGSLFTNVVNIIFKAIHSLNKQSIGSFSLVELTNIVKFCRHFVQDVRYFVEVLMKLIVEFAFLKVQDAQSKDPNVQILFLSQLVKCCVQLNKTQALFSIETKIICQLQQRYKNNFLLSLELIEIRLNTNRLWKTQAQQKICWIVSQMKGKVKLIPERQIIEALLIKLHIIGQIIIDKDTLLQFTESLNLNLQTQSITSNQLIQIWGRQPTMTTKQEQIQSYKSIAISFFKNTKIKNNPIVYLYFLRMGYHFKDANIIDYASKCLCQLNLQPSTLIQLFFIIKNGQRIASKELAAKIIKDVCVHQHVLKSYYLDILFYINITFYDIPQEYLEVFSKMLSQIEKQLLQQKEVTGKNENGLMLSNLLIKTYKYYWIVIKNKQITDKTYEIFEVNVKNIKKVYQILQLQTFHQINQKLVYLFHVYLSEQFFKKLEKIEKPVIKKQDQPKKSFFSPKISKKMKQNNNALKEQYFLFIKKIFRLQKWTNRSIGQLEQQLLRLKPSANMHEEAPLDNYIKYCAQMIGKQDLNENQQFKGKVKLFQELYRKITQVIAVNDKNSINQATLK